MTMAFHLRGSAVPGLPVLKLSHGIQRERAAAANDFLEPCPAIHDHDAQPAGIGVQLFFI